MKDRKDKRSSPLLRVDRDSSTAKSASQQQDTGGQNSGSGDEHSESSLTTSRAGHRFGLRSIWRSMGKKVEPAPSVTISTIHSSQGSVNLPAPSLISANAPYSVKPHSNSGSPTVYTKSLATHDQSAQLICALPPAASATIQPPPPLKSLWDQTYEITQKKLAEKDLPLLEHDFLQGTSAQDAIRLLYKDLEDAARDKQGQRQQFAERWGKLLKTGDKYAKIVDIAIQHSPEVTSLVWAGARAILQVALNYVEATECLEAAMECIMNKLVICEFYASIYEEMMNPKGPHSPTPDPENFRKLRNSLSHALPHLYAAIIVFSVKARQFFDRFSLDTVKTKVLNWVTPFAIEVQPFIDSISEEENNIRKYADMATMEKIKESSKHIAEIEHYIRTELKPLVNLTEISATTKETLIVAREILEKTYRVLDENVRKLLKNLSPLEPLKRHSDIRSTRYEEAGSWLLNHDYFRSWRDGWTPDTPDHTNTHVLLCHGMPGAGKTTLSSLVVDHLVSQFITTPKVTVVCLYSDYRDQSKQTLVNILGTFLHQILTSPAILHLPDEVTKSLEDIRQRNRGMEVTDCLAMLKRTLQDVEYLYICIDALDELAEGTRRNLLKILKTEFNMKATRIFLTSRSQIQQEIMHYLAIDAHRVIDITASQDDIREFVSHKINEDRVFNPDEITPNLENEILTAIVNRSQGMFLLPALHIKMILSQKTKAGRRKALAVLPTSVYSTFKTSIERIKQSEEYGKLGMQALMWLHFATRPLKLKELQHALAVTEGDTEFQEDNIPSRKVLLDSCFGLVIVDEETKTVRLVHYTLKEYFVHNSNDHFPNGHTTIAKLCLTYLCLDQVKQYCKSGQQLEELSSRFPFVEYGALNWGNYAREHPTDDVKALALNLLKHERWHPFSALQFIIEPQHRWGPISSITGVHVAAYFGLVEIILLLENQGDTNLPDGAGNTPISLASRKGHKQTVQLLLARDDVDVNAGKPLAIAAKEGHTEIVELLLARDDVDINVGEPLAMAAREGYADIVKLLLARDDVDVNAGEPLVMAAEKGHREIVQLLLARDDIDVKKEYRWGGTALSLATEFGHQDIVRLLLARDDIDVNAGEPLAMAAEQGHKEIVQLLLARSDVYINAGGPLTKAVWKRYPEIVLLLLTRDDLDINAASKPLAIAAWAGYTEIVELLLARNDVDVNAGEPLAMASEQGHGAIVELLLAKDDIDVNAGEPLAMAAEQGHREIVQLLLAKDDIDVTKKNHSGGTALSLATKRGYQDIVQLLLARNPAMAT